MTSQKLKQIEERYLLGENDIAPFTQEMQDMKLLLIRVKRLTEALKFIVTPYPDADHYVELYRVARKALQDELEK